MSRLRRFKFLKKGLCRWVLLPACLALLAGCPGEPGSAAGTQTLRLALHAEPPTLDWSLATDGVSFDVLTNIMEGLTQYNDQLEPVPAVAQRWEFSEGGRVITYYLREDVFWTDGEPVTAHDFEYSWKRLLNPATAAEYAYFLFDIENAFEYNSGKIKDAGNVGVRALSPTVLQVRLKRPVVYFPSITTFMVTFPQRRDVIERFGDHWTDPENIVTNGPFILKEWRHEYKLVLKTNPGYYDTPPGVDRVVMYVARDRNTELTLYETGELDIAELPPVAIPHFKNSKEYQNLPLLRGYYYGFNITKPPFDDPRVRRALSHAIDRSRIPLILKGGELATSSWIPKGMFGYNAHIGPQFDVERARALLAGAGYPDGRGFPEFSLVYNTDPTHRLIAQFVQSQWKQHLGLRVSLEDQEWKVFLKMLNVDPPPVFRLGWGADFPDPDNFMNLFTSTSGNNRLGWKNPRYDRLIAEGAAERDARKRRAIYDEAQTLLTDTDAVIISLFVTAQNVLVKPYVRGLELNAMEWMYLKRVHLAKK
ncbi:MAG: peptide ABC transporter substrate-binding protein [Nitrospinaceae bacterium]|nr:peptide ABC transporter substrate-binding protein [Nitrospinaceae bacterium]NIR57314.1 peptide ABC transporter substrate-binding protein [Nitrospinaceae bacterium]NIS87766.1 peptide ABC transporter substrate-binding protein [Nitrospinaceae bacterium]NIT84636.1 peptide ABC transporter substrate-binding protein [Nitrospinaceae bacterium]NIU46815.1 peptide ABC transporter substrate-binding protein [Nitrospinaceae bacterium]